MKKNNIHYLEDARKRRQGPYILKQDKGWVPRQPHGPRDLDTSIMKKIRQRALNLKLVE